MALGTPDRLANAVARVRDLTIGSFWRNVVVTGDTRLTMPFHRRRALGPPEILGLLLVVALVVPAWLWWRDVLTAQWAITSGSVLACDIRATHYNAQDYRPVVTMRYRYVVHGEDYQAEWRGLWPEAGSPNALMRDQLEQLRMPGRPLVIYYNPSNPLQSSPHEHGAGRELTYASATVVALCVVVWYFVWVFPNRARWF